MPLPERDHVPEGVRALAHRWLGPWLEIARAASGGSTLVYRIQRGRETFWLRLAEEAGEDRSAEWDVHRRLVAAGARVPDIVIAEVAPPELDRSACITTHTPGVPLLECRNPAVAHRVAMDAGRDLAVVNAIDVRGYGFVRGLEHESGEIVASSPNRGVWNGEVGFALARIAETGGLSPHVLRTLAVVLDPWLRDSETTHGHAAHGDFDTSHIYHDPATGAYTGIIDFGELMGADRAWDLGHALVHDGQGDSPPIADALIAGWGEVDHEGVRICAIVVALRRFARHHASPYGAFLATRIGDLLP